MLALSTFTSFQILIVFAIGNCDVAKTIIGNLSNLHISQEILQVLCLAWQWKKGLIKSKKAKGQKYCSMNEQDCLKIVMDYLQKDYAIVKKKDWIPLLLVEINASTFLKEKEPSFFASTQ